MKLLVPNPWQEYDHLGNPVDGTVRYVERETYERWGGHGRKLSTNRLRFLHGLYQEGYSLNEIAARIWRQEGYASAKVAGRCLLDGFKRLGLPLRSRAEGSRLSAEKRRHPDLPSSAEDRAAYERARRKMRGQPKRARPRGVRRTGRGTTNRGVVLP